MNNVMSFYKIKSPSIQQRLKHVRGLKREYWRVSNQMKALDEMLDEAENQTWDNARIFEALTIKLEKAWNHLKRAYKEVPTHERRSYTDKVEKLAFRDWMSWAKYFPEKRAELYGQLSDVEKAKFTEMTTCEPTYYNAAREGTIYDCSCNLFMWAVVRPEEPIVPRYEAETWRSLVQELSTQDKSWWTPKRPLSYMWDDYASKHRLPTIQAARAFADKELDYEQKWQDLLKAFKDDM